MTALGEGRRMVGVLHEDPGLADQLTERAAELARVEAIAPLITVRPGPWAFVIDQESTRGHLGLLVLEGLLARHVTIGPLGSTEFLGTGDLLRPWGVDSGVLSDSRTHWEVLTPTRLAALDGEFARRVRPWPEISAELLDRCDARARSLAFQLALRQAVRVEDRVLVAMRHLADRWGRVGSTGTSLMLPQTSGEVLARIVGARRQSVSVALGRLRRRGLIEQQPSGAWILHEYPDRVQQLKRGRRASDRQADDLLASG